MFRRMRLTIACLTSLALLSILFHWVLVRSGRPGNSESDGRLTDASHGSPGRNEIAEPNGSSHEPLEACENCHDSESPDETKARELSRQVPKLCFRCHEDESKTYPYVHGPVAVGQCLFCHNPHKSMHAHLLNQDATELCALCHARRGLRSIEDHLEPSNIQCLECHNSHASTARFLLKAKRTESDPEKRGNVP